MQALSEDREERDFFEPYDPMGELKTKATIAAKVGVPLDQVDIVNGTATIFLDAQQVKRLKST
jgi:hypothetical protein|tara:strand:- start:642 stop:830 length:189 start_codon:yes stop_codon:yes gene_type:complete